MLALTIALGAKRLPLTDALGSTLALAMTDGCFAASYAYEPYGAATISGDPVGYPFTYTGREDDGTGLYDYRARYYSPEYGRFISQDPVGFAGGLSFYAYVGGNPISNVDPLGLDTYTLHMGVSIPFVGGFDIGGLYSTGANGPDLGIFLTLQKNYGGLGRAKATLGVSQTLGERCEFDGTDAQLHAGLGAVGIAAGGLDRNTTPTSLSFDFGPQIGVGADLPQTFSLTVGDLARGAAYLIHGPGGR